ncbi:MAG: hypothetical protein ABJF10_24410, partial [Chthoniobacter sp.]
TAAPAYQRQAASLVQVQKFEAALERIGFAIALAPDNADYPLFQANTLQAMQRLPEAAASYRRVLTLRPTDAVAKTNLELGERLLADAAGKPLSKSQQAELLQAVVTQKRSADGVFLASALARQDDERLAKMKEQLAPATQQPQWTDTRLARREDGTVTLDLSDLALPDLALLHDLPISALNIARTGVTDFTPLAALPLTKLDCSGNPLADLLPLKGKALEELALRDCPVTDLTVLQGMPLATLNLAGTPITSLEALRGLPLRRLDCFGCPQLTDFSPLTTLPALETLNLPTQFTDLALLQKIRTLQRLGSGDFGTGTAAFDKVPTVAAFLAARGQQLALLSRLAPRLEQLRQTLRQLGAPESSITAVSVGVDGFMDLDLTALPLDNLAVLSGLPIRRLVIKSTKISDLTPLRGLPLTTLEASDTAIKDLTPLAACPTLLSLDVSQTSVTDLRPLAALKKLDRLAISRTAVRDLAPLQHLLLRELYFDDTKVEEVFLLATCPALTSITIPGALRDPNPLRRMPALQRISNTRDPVRGLPTQSTAEFWASYDAGGKTREAEEKMKPILARLRSLDGWTEDRFQKLPDGTYRLNLSRLPVAEVTFLRDLPISNLDLSYTSVTRIGPLAGCPMRQFNGDKLAIADLSVLSRWPLERLEFSPTASGDAKVLHGLSKLRYLDMENWTGYYLPLDLGPLRGLPLEFFKCSALAGLSFKPLEGAPLKELILLNCETVGDLQPLRKMPLTTLVMEGTRVSDIASLRALPLTIINLKNSQMRDVAWLAGCNTLENIILPRNAIGIDKLRNLPNQKRIGFEAKTLHDPGQSAGDFWAEFDKSKKP